MARILTITLVFAFNLCLSACGWRFRYQSWDWVDNNCSGNDGIHSDAFCSDYTKGVP
jgi:hypothetical protein